MNRIQTFPSPPLADLLIQELISTSPSSYFPFGIGAVPAAVLCPFGVLWRLDSKAGEEWEAVLGLSGIWETKQ